MVDPLCKAILAICEMIWKRGSETLDGFSAFCRMSVRPMRLAPVFALALCVASARAGSMPDNFLDACTGGEGSIRVVGWAYDPDAPSQSLDIHVYLYSDSGCANQYGNIRLLSANVSRPDVNQVKGITGNHGFDAEISVPDAGTYWVKVFAIDATGDANPQIGTVRSANVTAVVSSGNTPAVAVTKFHQSYPHSGKATIEYTVAGTLPANAVAEIVLDTGDARATFVQPGVATGANSHTIDFAASFGGALVLTNASFTVSITVPLGGVQLWENGPYWAECNVGASKPEEYGYYFWWGDTVGYVPTGGSQWSVNGGISYKNVTWKSSTNMSMSDSPFTGSCPIYGKVNSALLAEGWIDAAGNLAAAHDAATVHLGSPWRMPTKSEFVALTNYCTFTWIVTNGVQGRLVSGKGEYADRSIFLPAAGYGLESDFFDPHMNGNYWSSTPDMGGAFDASYLFFSSGAISQDDYDCYLGHSVRALRGAVICGADGVITCDPSETQTTPTPVPNAWIDNYPALLAGRSGDYEAAANATAANGRKVWECYATGLNPSNPLDDFRITRFWMDGNMPMFEFNHTTDGSGNSILPCIKPLGKANFTDTWLQVPEGGAPSFRFFSVEVVPPGCKSSFMEFVEAVDIPVTKIWNDNNNADGNRPATVTLRLYADGVEVDSHVLSGAEDWKFTFVDKPRYQDDNTTEIAYTVGEDAVAMYAATINGYCIVNDYQPEVTSVSVSKVWDDNNDEQNIRPDSIAMSLSDGQKTVKVVVLNEANGWTATVNNLPTVVNGQSAQYGWKEQAVLGYDLEGVAQQGSLMIFTNKVWERPENPTSGRRPKTRGNTWYVFEDYDTPL